MSIEFNSHVYEKLKGKNTGEAFDIDMSIKWLIYHMPYEDFVKFTTLRFENFRTETPHSFSYIYGIKEKDDTAKTRRNYLRYYFYKLYQNLATDGIELIQMEKEGFVD